MLVTYYACCPRPSTNLRQNMRKVGNVSSNKIYNPEHRKPPVPVDVDEADGAMERFIRAKYMNNVAKSSGKPRYPDLDEGTPPPLPPKNSAKFGFRSASSIFPLSSKSKKEARMAAAVEAVRAPSPRPTSKPSKVFGATLDFDHTDESDEKLARLRDMGFTDQKRNALVLKGVNGNLERAIEALVRLGEGGRPSPLPTPSPREHTLRTSRSLTPLTPGSGGLGLGAGLSVPSRSATDRPTTPSSVSTNPFDMLPPAQPQTAQSTGNLQNRNPYSPTASTNPFGVPAPKPQHLDPFSQAFQGMSLSPQQPLFPHHTGGPAPQPTQQQVVYQQPAIPSAPTSPNNYQGMNFGSMTYPQAAQTQPMGYNPFFSNMSNSSSPVAAQPPQQIGQPALSVNTAQAQNGGYNPFARSPTRIASPSLGQIPEQTQTSFQSPAAFQSTSPFQTTGLYQSPAPVQPQAPVTNPFFAQSNQPATQVSLNPFGQPKAIQPPILQQQQYTQQPFGQQVAGQQQLGQQQYGQQLFGQQNLQQTMQQQQQMYAPQRPDKSSIMALYNNYPQLTPQNPMSSELAPQPTQPQTIPENQVMQTPMALVQQQTLVQPAATNNPFLTSHVPSSAPMAKPDPFAARSRESMNLGMDLAWTNGRHSPDAFASLSARHA